MIDAVAAPRQDLLKRPTYSWALSALGLSLLAAPVRVFLGIGWGLGMGTAAVVWSAYVFVWSWLHPRIYLGKRWALAGLAFSGVIAYTAFGELAYSYMWRKTFQMSDDLAMYEDPADKWSVLYPALWTRKEQRVSGTVNHVFKPSKITPAISFSVTRRANVGTEDLGLIVEGFFMNLPKGAGTWILEKEPAKLPTGEEAYRVVYAELSRRIPLKSEVLFVLHGGNLYFLTVEATPRWFDRHRTYLEKLLYSLTLPPA